MKIKKIVSISAILVIMLGLFMPINVSMMDKDIDTTPPTIVTTQYIVTRQIFCRIRIMGDGDFLRVRPYLYWEIGRLGGVSIYGYNVQTKSFEELLYVDGQTTGRFMFFFGYTERDTDNPLGDYIHIRGFALMSITYQIN